MLKTLSFSLRSLFSPQTPRGTNPHHAATNALQNARTLAVLQSEPYGGSADAEFNATVLRQALMHADSGSPADMAVLIERMLERDGIIRAHVQTRFSAVSGKVYGVCSTAHPDIAAACEKMLEKAELPALIEHLLTAYLYGYAGAVIDWEEGGRTVRSFTPILPHFFSFDSAGNVFVCDAHYHPQNLTQFHPNQFVFMRGVTSGRMACKRAAGRTLLYLHLLKQTALRNWGRFIEKFGMPLLLGHVPEGSTHEQVGTLMQALSKMARDGVGVSVGDGSALQTLECSRSGSDHQRLCAYIDDVIARTILGQLASSGEASGLSGGTVQSQVRQDLCAADARMVMRAIQQQIIDPYLKMVYNLDASEHDVRFYIRVEPEKERASYAAYCAQLAQACDRNLDAQWVENEFGIRLGDCRAKSEGKTAMESAKDV